MIFFKENVTRNLEAIEAKKIGFRGKKKRKKKKKRKMKKKKKNEENCEDSRIWCEYYLVTTRDVLSFV